MIAECVANSPGGPVHVLLSDTEAEHIPGCNMAFRKSALEAIGGFDPRFRTAGDDVDVCWRLVERGGRIGFHAGAMVWHHRRNSVRTYWKQQRGYGRAEALLERKWPEKYNAPGHLSWAGRLYGRGLTAALSRARGRIYQGHAGTALFQSVYQPAPGLLASLPLMPEWYLAIFALAAIAALGVFWMPLFFAAAVARDRAGSAVRASGDERGPRDLPGKAGSQRASPACLDGDTPLDSADRSPVRAHRVWLDAVAAQGSWPGAAAPAIPRAPGARSGSRWKRGPRRLRCSLKRQEAAWRPGGDFDDWDFEVRGGLFASARLLSTVEEHGGGRQMVRFRAWPRLSAFALAAFGAFGALALAAAYRRGLACGGGARVDRRG